MIQLLTPRELSIFAWLTIIFLWAMFQKSIRTSILSVIKSFFSWKILTLFAIVILYALAMAYAYISSGLGYDRIWLDTSLWILYGFFLVGKYITKRSYSNIWREVIRENLRGVLFLELIINTYTFNFLAEFFLIPLITFITMFGVVAKSDEKNSSVAKLTDSLLGVIGLTILAYGIVQVVNNPGAIKNIETLSSLSLPLALAVGFIPLIYFFLVVSCYEEIFQKLNSGISKSSSFKRKATWNIFKKIGLDYKKLNSFLSQKNTALKRVTSLEDLHRLLTEVEEKAE